MGQDIRDRFSGAVGAFARRNGSGSGKLGEHSRHKTSDDIPSSKDVVLILLFLKAIDLRNFLLDWRILSVCLHVIQLLYLISELQFRMSYIESIFKMIVLSVKE